MMYAPGWAGARTENENVTVAPGGTLCSVVVATRFVASHPTPSAARAVLSPLTPRFTCAPFTPRCHVVVPVLTKRTVRSAVSPGPILGCGLWSSQRAWNEDGAGAPALDRAGAPAP